MAGVPRVRHLLRARDLVDGRYFEPLSVADLAGAAGLSPAHFSREFKRALSESPHQYLLTRRLDPPTTQAYGIDTSFRDPSGNNIRLTQVLEFDPSRP